MHVQVMLQKPSDEQFVFVQLELQFSLRIQHLFSTNTSLNF